jgi:hypothetical protein|tara:strand:- start:1757 stop:2035 length:279 start_codon:yes stop_codon:yes gene_type:complete
MTTNLYWTEDGKAKNLALLTSTEHLEIQETLRLTEARDWIYRYRKKVKQLGQQEARTWWEAVKVDINKRRGQDGLNILITEMQRQRNDVNRI